MNDHVFDVGLHEGLGLGAFSVEFATGLEQVHGKTHFAAGFMGVGTHLMSGLRTPQKLSLGLPWRGLGKVGRLAHVFADQPPRTSPEDIAHADVSVQDLAGAWVAVAGPHSEADVSAHKPADRGVDGVHVVEFSCVGLLPHNQGILEPDALKGLVPFQHTGRDCRAIALRDIAVEPEGDGLHGLGQRRRRVLLVQPPAFDVVHPVVGPQVVGQVGVAVDEVAHARVGAARRHGLVGHGAKVVDETDEQAARVGCGPGRLCLRRRRRTRYDQRRSGQAWHSEMQLRRQRGQRRFGAGRLKVRIRPVDGKGHSVCRFQPGAVAGHVGEQETGFDQHRFALRVGRADDGR